MIERIKVKMTSILTLRRKIDQITIATKSRQELNASGVFFYDHDQAIAGGDLERYQARIARGAGCVLLPRKGARS